MSLCPYEIKEKTLVLGAGGGFDIYGCLYWYFSLTNEQKEFVVLANYTFTDDVYTYSTTEHRYIVPITSETKETKKNKSYFPELHLARSLHRTVYAVRMIANPLLFTELEAFILKNEIKSIILVDGGIDAMLFGDERPFGSPLEDSQTILAAHLIATKYKDIKCRLMCCGLYIDEVCPATFLKHWHKMASSRKVGMQCTDIKEIHPEAVQIIQTSGYASIMHESILAAVHGHRGRHLNPQLYPERISEPLEMPELYDETCKLWWLENVSEYIALSPFYQQLVKYMDQSKGIASVQYTCEDNLLSALWLFWDNTIGEILKGKQFIVLDDASSEELLPRFVL